MGGFDALTVEQQAGQWDASYQTEHQLSRSQFFLEKASRGIKSTAKRGRPPAAQRQSLKSKSGVRKALEKGAIKTRTGVKYNLLRCKQSSMTPKKNGRRLACLFGFLAPDPDEQLAAFLAIYMVQTNESA